MMFYQSLRTKVSIFAALLVACLLSVMSFLTLSFVKKEMKSAIYVQQTTLTSAIAEELDFKISLYRKELVEVAKSISPGMVADGDEAQKFIDSRLDTIAMFDSGLFLFTPDGGLLAGSLPYTGSPGNGSSGKELVKVAQSKAPLISEPLLNERGHAVVMFSAPILTEKGEVAAVLIGTMDLMKKNFLREIALGESGFFYLVDKNRTLIAHPDDARVMTSVAAGANKGLEQAIAGFEGTLENRDSKGKHLLNTFRRINSTGWILSANYPLQDAYAAISRTRQTMLTALLVMVAASIVVVWLTMRRLMAPLLSFTRQVGAISGDDSLPMPVQIHTGDEIEGLATAFNRLMEDVASHKNLILEDKEFELSLIQHSPLPTFVVKANHTLLHWNKACEKMTGIAAQDILGTDGHWKPFYRDKRPTLADIVIDRSYEQFSSYPSFEKIAQCLHAEGWYPQLNGEDRYLSFYASPIFSTTGELVAAIETIEDSTERKRSEESLCKLSCAVRQSPTAILITDKTGVIDYVNAKFTALTGFQPEEIIGKNSRSLLSSEMPHEYFKNMRQSVSSGQEWNGDFSNRKKSGEFYWNSVSIAPVKNKAGEITHYVAFMEEITERKIAEEKILQTLSLLNATLESTADGILVRDLAGTLQTCNRKFIEMWALPESVMATMDDRIMRSFVLDQLKDPEKFLEITENLYIRPELESCDILELKDGRVFERVSRPQILAHQIAGRVVSFRDITEREKAAEALRESAELYRSLVENIDLGITLIDCSHRIVMTNSAARRMFNKPADDLAQKECFQEFENRPTICGHCPGSIAMQTGKPAFVQTEGIRDDGSNLAIKIKASPVFGSDGRITGFIEVIQDVTDQIQADREKMQLAEQLRQSQKLEAIGTLSGGIAHDFNNFLTVIMGYCALIEIKTSEGDPLRQYLNEMTVATERAAKLTSSLLAYSRKQVLAPRRVDLKDIVRKVSTLLERFLGDDIDLLLQLSDEPLIIIADSMQIEQCLINLAVNARDAMPCGGLLQIAAERLELDADFVRVHGYGIPGRYALLTVSDSGEGMDAEIQKRIFEPFFTTKEVGKGTGLGLSMVYGIVKQHEGFINTYSESDKGSTFRIYLPITELNKVETKGAESFRPEGGSETILLVEDDPEIRKSLKELLEKAGYTIIEAVDGEDGIRKFAAQRGEVQLLLLDVIMPKLNGKETYERIRVISPKVKVLFMSGYTADVLSAKGMLHKELNLISKPFSLSTLSAKIREVLDK